MSDSNSVIEIKNLHKHFKLPTESSTSLKQIVINWLKGIKGYKKQTVLNGISFDIEKGDFFGIVGRNGSGKSTLLKLISGIYYPNRGSIKVKGSLVSFIELGVGFNPELTGRENIYLNGALMGFTTKEIDAMYDEIVEFAELGEFMDQKLKNYSSGMQVRLAFSCAIRAHSDILVLDEILAVGDEAFQKKCNDFFANIKSDPNKTVVLVTHSMASVRKYCNKAVLINDGKIEAIGSPDAVATAYSIENIVAGDDKNPDAAESYKDFVKDCQIHLKSPKVIDEHGEHIQFEVKYSVLQDIDTFVGLTLWDIKRNQALVNSDSKPQMTSGKGQKTISVDFTLPALNDCLIRVLASVRNSDGDILYFVPHEQSPIVTIRRHDYPASVEKDTDAVLFGRGEVKLRQGA